MGGWAANGDVLGINETYDPRVSFASVVDDHVYTIGGHTDQDATATVEVYDVAADTWEAAAPMPVARVGAGAAVVDGIIYVIGGQTVEWAWGPVVTTVEVYDPATDRWESRSDMPTARTGFGTVALGGLIYAIGGAFDGGAPTQIVEIYNPTSDKWTTGIEMDAAVSFLTAHPISGVIYAVGGRPNGQGVVAFDTGTRRVSPRGKMVVPWGSLRQ
jgi:N-acetylneuraminic acid mutarotase